MLRDAYRRLPTANHLDTIPGIGTVSAAVLIAFILDIERFASPGKVESDKPFDPRHYAWEEARPDAEPKEATAVAGPVAESEELIAGHKPEAMPAAQVVAAACDAKRRLRCAGSFVLRRCQRGSSR